MTPSEQSDGPRKAYLVQWRIENVMEAIVYADSVADARRRFDDGEADATAENTFQDRRVGSPKVRRYPDEDRCS